MDIDLLDIYISAWQMFGTGQTEVFHPHTFMVWFAAVRMCSLLG